MTGGVQAWVERFFWFGVVVSVSVAVGTYWVARPLLLLDQIEQQAENIARHTQALRPARRVGRPMAEQMGPPVPCPPPES